MIENNGTIRPLGAGTGIFPYRHIIKCERTYIKDGFYGSEMSNTNIEPLTATPDQAPDIDGRGAQRHTGFARARYGSVSACGTSP